MAHGFRTAILAAALIALGTSPATAKFFPGCANPADSALNQYCDVMPSATGAHQPKAGDTAAAAALPPQIVRQIEQGPRGVRALLHVPAARKAPTGGRSALASHVSKASAAGLPGWLIGLLAALVALMLAAAIVQSRRSRAGREDGPPA